MENIIEQEELVVDIKDVVPSAFRSIDEGAEVGASELYQFMTTSDIIDMVEGFGWKMFKASQTRSKKYPTTCKHMLRFRNPQFFAIDGLIPEILLINSHNRTSALTLHVGLFRIICANGLVVADKTFGKVSVRHQGTTFEDVKQSIKDIIESIPTVIQEVNRYKEIKLTNMQKLEFAAKAVAVRYPEYTNFDGTLKHDKIGSDVDLMGLITPLRHEDEESDLFTVMNVVQEKLVQGKYNRRGLRSGKVSKAKAITNIRSNMMVNTGLWDLMASYK